MFALGFVLMEGAFRPTSKIAHLIGTGLGELFKDSREIGG